MRQEIYEIRLGQAAVLSSVEAENQSQLVKWNVQDHPLWRWFLILTEEMGEAIDAYLQSASNVPNDEYYLLAHLVDLGLRAQALLEGELVDRVNSATHAPDLGKEMIQIAAVAVAAEENRRRNEVAA